MTNPPGVILADRSGEARALPRDLSPWGMFLAADVVVKGVMIGLAFASVLVWSIWLSKSLALRSISQRMQQDLGRIRGLASIDEAVKQAPQNSIAGALLDCVTEERLRNGNLGVTGQERIKSRFADIDAGIGSSLRSGMSILATIGATAPFVGLFGTVWGIMNSFIGISKLQTTNLAVVAPGIAEALLATAMGLVAAIPAVVLYNQLGRSIANARALARQTAHEVERIALREMESPTTLADHAKLPRAAE